MGSYISTRELCEFRGIVFRNLGEFKICCQWNELRNIRSIGGIEGINDVRGIIGRKHLGERRELGGVENAGSGNQFRVSGDRCNFMQITVFWSLEQTVASWC